MIDIAHIVIYSSSITEYVCNINIVMLISSVSHTVKRLPPPCIQ